MKKTFFVVALLVSAALAGCHHKKANTTGGGGSGSEPGPRARSNIQPARRPLARSPFDRVAASNKP